MLMRSIRALAVHFARFRSSKVGNVAITFALVLTPLAGAVGAGVDIAGAIKDKNSMQGALDASAIALAKTGSTLSSSQIQAAGQKWFDSAFKEADVTNVVVAAQYDSNAKTATVSATGTYPTALLKIMGVNTLPVSASATAKIEGRKWPICVEVTSPASNHTLITMTSGQINFTNCMVQVNTQNWDAVEARNSSYIHSTNGDNCFVGDIHFGDILPAKDPSCEFFPDPFAGYAMPASVSSCTYTDMIASVSGTTLAPGTYCGGLQITRSANLQPGLYIIRDGDLKISGGGTTVTGDGVTILFTGDNTPGIEFSDGATINLTAARSGVGNFAGFVFYFDQGTAAGCIPPKDGAQVQKATSKTVKKGQASTSCISVIRSSANVTLSGIVYMIGQQFLIEENSEVTFNPGTLIADMIVVTTNAHVTLTGDLNATTSAEIALQKQGTGPSPVLIR